MKRKRGRPHRTRIQLQPATLSAIRESGFFAHDDEAGWLQTGHVFGTELSPHLVALIVELHSLENVYLQPQLDKDQTAEVVHYFAKIQSRAKDALSKAESMNDPNFSVSLRIITEAIQDPPTLKLWREVSAIANVARSMIATSGGHVTDYLDEIVTRVQLGSTDTGDVRKQVEGRGVHSDRDRIRNLLKRLKFIER
jgi:hypothetical protein